MRDISSFVLLEQFVIHRKNIVKKNLTMSEVTNTVEQDKKSNKFSQAFETTFRVNDEIISLSLQTQRTGNAPNLKTFRACYGSL